MGLLLEVVTDSLWDTLVLLPFLFLTYLAMEAIEHRASERLEEAVAHAGGAGPVVGSLLGALPQCGFSAMAATLFSGGVVTAGTLVAVVLSTSDEMVPVFLAHQESPARMLAIIGIKVAAGMLVGFGVDVGLRLLGVPRTKQHIHDLCERAGCGCDDDGDERVHDHSHGTHGAWFHIVRSALVHTGQVSAFILIVTFVCGLVIEVVGRDALGAFLSGEPVAAVLLSALVGLVPSCGASVAITELYLSGTLSFGAALAGLLSSGGVGLLVLWRTNANARQNLVVTAFVYAVSAAVGLMAVATGIIV